VTAEELEHDVIVLGSADREHAIVLRVEVHDRKE
jgi:hypothetical protein